MTLKHILQLVQDRDPNRKPTTPKPATPKSVVDENVVALHALGDDHVNGINWKIIIEAHF